MNALSRALEVLGGDACIETLSERQELLRFGASCVTYQHSEERLIVRVKLVRDGRAVWGTLGSLEPAALRDLSARLEDAVCRLPPNDAWIPSPNCHASIRPARTAFASTERMDAAQRVEMFSEIVNGLPSGTDVGGSVATTVTHHAMAASTGLQRDEKRTRAMVQVIAARGARSAFARTLHRDAAELDIARLVTDAKRWLEPLPERSLDRGVYRAVLQPPAVGILLASLGQWAFNGRTFNDGESVFASRLGQRVLSQALTLTDDGADPRGLPTGFDSEGTPKARVPLIVDGVLMGQVTDTVTARGMRQPSTGHAMPPGWRFGVDPYPSHLILEPGALSDDDLLHACGTGLSIQRVDYVRVVHARETVVTGTTRDATCWIENGRVVGRVPQFRFTLRLVDLFNTVEALGNQLERGEMVFMESVVAPAALVSAFPVDSVVSYISRVRVPR